MPDVSFPVDFKLIPVSAGEYLFWKGQEWAEPDIDHATRLLIHVVDNPEIARAVGAKARAHMLDRFSDRTLGALYDERFSEIARQRQRGTLSNAAGAVFSKSVDVDHLRGDANSR